MCEYVYTIEQVETAWLNPGWSPELLEEDTSHATAQEQDLLTVLSAIRKKRIPTGHKGVAFQTFKI